MFLVEGLFLLVGVFFIVAPFSAVYLYGLHRGRREGFEMGRAVNTEGGDPVESVEQSS